jgi:hypothetical protein
LQWKIVCQFTNVQSVEDHYRDEERRWKRGRTPRR